MKKNIILIIIAIILTTMAFCGCGEDESAIKIEKSGTVKLESSIVELVDSKFEFIKTSEYDPDCDCEIEFLKSVEVGFLFHNIAGRDIAASVTAELYDKEGNILWISPQPKTINLPTDYTEVGYLPANSFSYDGQRLDSVDYAVLVVTDT